MSFIALYAENASVVGTYADRPRAVRAAIEIAMRRPDLSTDIGIAEVDDADGHVIVPFVSASDLLAADDHDAVTTAATAATRLSAPDTPRREASHDEIRQAFEDGRRLAREALGPDRTIVVDVNTGERYELTAVADDAPAAPRGDE